MSKAFAPVAVRAWRTAAQALGWRPDDFWNATPREWRSALADEGEPGADRATLEALMARFPDGRG